MWRGPLVPVLCLAVLLAACGDDAPPTSGAAPGAEPTRQVLEPPPLPPAAPRADERERMVAWHIEPRGIGDPLVLRAMRHVPRHLFIPDALQAIAYHDRPVGIGWDQTISQPYVVASMTEEARVEPGSVVLEIGTGSGYQAAVLATITRNVYSIEIKEPLAKRARTTLDETGFPYVTTKQGDGYDGWEEHAPFDAILVTAAAPHIPPPLVRQLARGGRMVIPVGGAMAIQDLMLVTKDEKGTVRTKSLYAVTFVPLTGRGAEK